MSNGSVYQRKDKRWCAQYMDADSRNRYLYRKTKREAKQALREALKDKDDGIFPSSLTVNDVLIRWLQESKTEVSTRTLDNREYLIRVHFSPHPIASTKLADLNHDHLRTYMNSKNELAPSTRNKLLAILKHVGAEGVRFRVLRHSPTDGIKSVREDRELEILSANQIKHLLATVRGHKYELIVVLGATCGIRVGEALGACWEDIDFDRGTLKIKRTVWRGKVYPPKTKTSRRTLKLPQRASSALSRRYNKTSGYLCPTKSGKHTGNPHFHPYWKAILENAGLPRETTFHSLRHGAASLLLGQNVPIPVVSKYLGHSNPATTMRVYAHVIDGMGDIAASGMDDALL